MEDPPRPGRAPSAGPSGPAREPRRRLGRDGLAWFESLLGGPPAGWELERAAFTPREVDFALVRGPRRLELVAAPGARADVGGRPRAGIVLRLRAAADDRTEEELALSRAIEAGLSALAFPALVERLGRDALLYCDPDGSRVPSRLDRYLRRNDHSADFWKFVYPQWRCLEERVRLGERWTRVHFASLECRLSNPGIDAPSLRFFADEPANLREDGRRSVEPEIEEADVLGGRTQENLGRALEAEARDRKPAFIHVFTTCLPELLGDTPAPFLARIEKEHGVPVFWTSKTRPGGPLFSAWIDRLFAGVDPGARRDPRAVLLAGVPSEAARAEAEELLAGLGLRVVGSLLPDLDFRAVPEIGAASAVVWADPVGWETIDDAAFLRRGLAVVRHHPPYGLGGARAWLERAAAVLGLEGAGAAWERALAPRRAALEELRLECARRVVVLAGDAADVELLTSRGRAFGFSIAALLGELGFRVRCLVYAGGRASASLRRPRAPSGAGSIEFVPFSTPAALDRELGRGADLVFSHFNHDPRLAARGLPGFTEAAFEPGLDGLLRSARRLLDKCAARPFPRHRSLLTRRRP